MQRQLSPPQQQQQQQTSPAEDASVEPAAKRQRTAQAAGTAAPQQLSACLGDDNAGAVHVAAGNAAVIGALPAAAAPASPQHHLGDLAAAPLDPGELYSDILWMLTKVCAAPYAVMQRMKCPALLLRGWVRGAQCTLAQLLWRSHAMVMAKDAPWVPPMQTLGSPIRLRDALAFLDPALLPGGRAA